MANGITAMTAVSARTHVLKVHPDQHTCSFTDSRIDMVQVHLRQVQGLTVASVASKVLLTLPGIVYYLGTGTKCTYVSCIPTHFACMHMMSE